MSFALKSAAGSKAVRAQAPSRRVVAVKAGKYDEELIKTAHTIASKGRGILAMDESNATCGKRLDSIGVENTEENRRAYRELLISAPGLGQYISGAILFEETLYQSNKAGKSFVNVMADQGIVPGIKVDKGLVPLANTHESWCMGLDGLDKRCAEYYKAGARFAKWRSVISIPDGPSMVAQRDCAYGLARYAAIAQNAGLVPIVEPEVMLDGEHDIDRTLEVAESVWAETFKYMADNKVMFEGILLKPAMITPGADCKQRASPDKVAEYTLKMLRRRVPPAVPGIMFLSGGQSEMESTLNLNAMNLKPNPWHVSFSYARALQNTTLKTWGGKTENVKAAQEALLRRAKANSEAQVGQYDPSKEAKSASEGMFQKGYVYWTMATEPSSATLDGDLNLQILRRLDPEVDETRKNVEGSLFLLKRRKAPRFQMMVLNKLATENYIETIHGNFDFEVNAPYLMYTHGNSEIHGIWFYEQEDLDRLFGLLNRIKSGLPKTDVLPTPAAGTDQPASASGADNAFWDKQVEVAPGQVPLKPDMQPAQPATQPATQNLTNLLKQAHLKQQQSQQQQQQQQGDMSPPLLAPSFFQSQQAAPPVTASLASKQLSNLKAEAQLSPSVSGSFTGTPGQPAGENMLHKLFSKPAAPPPGTQPVTSLPPPTVSQPSLVPTSAVLASSAAAQQAAGGVQPTPQQQQHQTSLPNALAKLFSSASTGAIARAPRVSNPSLAIPAMPPVSPVTRQQPRNTSQEAVRDRVRAAFSQLLANDAFVDLISEQFKAVGLISDE